jgi:hypothetical protein
MTDETTPTTEKDVSWVHYDDGKPCPNVADTWMCDEHGEWCAITTVREVALTPGERFSVESAIARAYSAGPDPLSPSDVSGVPSLVTKAVEAIIAGRLAEIEARISAGPSCGVASRDHEGCYVQEALRAVRTTPDGSGADR